METPKLHPPDILIVEDDPINMKLLTYWCAKWGYSPDTALCGEEALSKTMKHSYKLLIIDIGLPGISGLELAKRVKKHDYNANIVFQSGISGDDFEGLNDENSYFLQKPYLPTSMAKIISFIMEKHIVKVSA